ncbi:MAG: extracellular solute-binding protein [Spirochaetes bacterium]|nr:extracellular solute-binding protein [Spirochaetota bacterium]
MRRLGIVLFTVVLLLAGTTLFAAPAVKELTILWAQWDPADYLQQLCKEYEAATGVKVNVIQEPWGSFADRFSVAMAAKGTEWDMVVGDSQWLGTGATSGQYVELTKFMNDNKLVNTVTPATLKFYGEYPANSKKYWAFPTEGDACGFAYRKDLFTDAAEKAAFKAKYGYNLDVPKTWKQFYDAAEFFTRPEMGLYGCAIYTQKDYDALSMGIETVLFSYGVNWQDEKNRVIGVVNSNRAVEAVKLYHDLYQNFSPPGLSNAFYPEMNDAFTSGKAAMVMNYFAFLPALGNKGTDPNYYDKVGYFVNPAGPYGDRFAALGGQGMSVLAYVSKERQQASLNFIKWFAQDKTQQRWAELGGYTCNAKTLKSDVFLKGQIYNPAFAETMTFVKDFWNIPVYGSLLQIAQKYLHKYVVEGVGTAKEAMDGMAKEQDQVLRENGYIK